MQKKMKKMPKNLLKVFKSKLWDGVTIGSIKKIKESEL